MKYSLLTLFTLVSTFTFAQITGTVTSNQNEPLPVVNIFIEHTYTGTTTNNDGNYLLDISKTGDYTITFQYLGYKTLKKTVTINKLPFVLDAVLSEEDINLDEVVINSDENPANIIIGIVMYQLPSFTCSRFSGSFPKNTRFSIQSM